MMLNGLCLKNCYNPRLIKWHIAAPLLHGNGTACSILIKVVYQTNDGFYLS